MNKFLVVYEPPERDAFPALKTWEELLAMIKTAEEQGGKLKVYRIRRGQNPELLTLKRNSRFHG